MKRGVIVGEVWATRQVPGLAGRRLTLVAQSDADADPERDGVPGDRDSSLVHASLVVAIDTLGARFGQEVLVAFGSGARRVLSPGEAPTREVLADAAVALLIDGASADGPGTDAARTAPAAAPAPPAEPGRARKRS